MMNDLIFNYKLSSQVHFNFMKARVINKINTRLPIYYKQLKQDNSE